MRHNRCATLSGVAGAGHTHEQKINRGYDPLLWRALIRYCLPQSHRPPAAGEMRWHLEAWDDDHHLAKVMLESAE